jgi:hypothetical protein
MWDTAAKVSTPLALAAFALAIAAFIWRSFLRKRKAEIEAAPLEQRLAMLSRLEDAFAVPVATLDEERRYKLALEILGRRAERFKIAAFLGVVAAVLLCVVVIVAMVVQRSSTVPSPTSLRQPAAGEPAMSSSADQPSSPPADAFHSASEPTTTPRPPAGFSNLSGSQVGAASAGTRDATPPLSVRTARSAAPATASPMQSGIRQRIVAGSVEAVGSSTANVGVIDSSRPGPMDQSVEVGPVRAQGSSTTNIGVIH